MEVLSPPMWLPSPHARPSGAPPVDVMDEIPVSLFHPTVTEAEREGDGEMVKTPLPVPRHSRFTSALDQAQPESGAAGMEARPRQLQAKQRSK